MYSRLFVCFQQNQLRDVNVKNLQLQSEIERKELSHANVIGELERQVNRLGDKNGSLAEDVKRVEKVLAQTKGYKIFIRLRYDLLALIVTLIVFLS